MERWERGKSYTSLLIEVDSPMVYYSKKRKGTLTYMVAQNEDTPRRHKADLLLVTATAVETQAVLNVFSLQGSTFAQLSIENSTYFDLGVIGGARTFLVQSEMGVGSPLAAMVRLSRYGTLPLVPVFISMMGMLHGRLR